MATLTLDLRSLEGSAGDRDHAHITIRADACAEPLAKSAIQ